MIEELTPRLLSTLMLFVVGIAPMLTLLLSAILLWRYRRAVDLQMAATVGFDDIPATDAPATAEAGHDNNLAVLAEAAALYRRAARGPFHLAFHYIGAGFAFALVFAVAAHFAYLFRLGVPGFLVGVWIYAWPVVAALMLIVPATRRTRVAWVLAYFAVFQSLVLWAGTVKDIPALDLGVMMLPARSSATPPLTMKLWLVANGAPTFLMLFCFNNKVRAVAPLVLGLLTTAISGTLAAYLVLFSQPGTEAVVALSVSLNLDVRWMLFGTFLLSFTAFGAVGWALARWIARAYRRRTVSDLSLMLDSAWLLFASWYAMWLILAGLAWTVSGPVAFVFYKLALMLARALAGRERQTQHGLAFLRVFSLGRRTERLFDRVTRYWRHIGSVQIITGPDVARSTVQPHQFLDFLSGRLATHFVRDAESLARSVAAWDRASGRDGRFRVNNVFCHADSWQRVLPQLVRENDVVLMDLRSFSEKNAGCIHELRHLVGNVPLGRCLLLVDDTTDLAFLGRTLRMAWHDLPADSPNRGRSPDETPLHRFGSGPAAVHQLLGRLCEAIGRPSPTQVAVASTNGA